MSLRTTLLALAFAASCAAATPLRPPAPPAPPPPQAANDSEALYRKMEAALTGAKNFLVEFDSTTDGASVKGSFKIGEGNKLEMKIEGAAGVKKYKLAMTCDGQKMNVTRSEEPPPPVPLAPQPELATPDNLAAHVALGLARGGAWLAQDFADGDYRMVADPYFAERQKAFEEQREMKTPGVAPRDVTPLHELKNFRSGGASAITYDLVAKGEKPVLMATFTVTIDAKTNLPTRREGSFFLAGDGKPTGAALSKWTEKYTFKN